VIAGNGYPPRTEVVFAEKRAQVFKITREYARPNGAIDNLLKTLNQSL
jgi:hypothetical protein